MAQLRIWRARGLKFAHRRAGRAAAGRPAGRDRGAVAPFLAATLSTQMLVAWGMVSMAAIAPRVAREVGVATVAIGYQVSLAYGGGMLSSLVAGTLVRRWGAVRTSQWCVVVCMAGCLLLTVPDLRVLAMGSVVVGMSYGLANPAASHLLARFARRSFFNVLFSVKQTGIPLGAMLAGLLAPYIAVHVGWRWVFVVVVAAGVFLATALQPARKHWDADRNPTVRLTDNPLDGLRLVWRVPVLRWLSLTALCFNVIQLCTGSFAVAFLVEEIGFGLVRAGRVLAVLQISGAFGRIVWGWMADRSNNGRAVLVGMAVLMTAGCFLAGTLSRESPPVLVYAALAFLGFCAVGWPGVYLAEVVRHSPPGRSGPATGGSLFLTYMGILFGPPLFARAYRILGTYGATYQLLMAAGVAGLLCVALTLRHRAEPPDDRTEP